LLKAAGFYAFNTFPEETFKLLKSLKSSSSIAPVRNAQVGISSTVAAGTMIGSGARLATGGIQADAYGYYAHHKTSSVVEIGKLMDISLASIYSHYLII
jgi:hypothetical protein